MYRAPTFTFGAVCDNKDMKKSNSRAFHPEHPLLADRDRLDRILDAMYAKINKTLFPRAGPVRRPRPEEIPSNHSGEVEQILYGTGISADDVLAEALIGLLQYQPERLEGTWEALAIGVAENKALDARRASQKGLGGTDHRSQLYLVSGDLERDGPDGEKEPSIFETLPSDWSGLEAEYFAMQDVLTLLNLARELLDERDLRVFLAIHFEGYSRRDMADRLGLTSQRVGQIYNAALTNLEADPFYPFQLPVEVEQ